MKSTVWPAPRGGLCPLNIIEVDSHLRNLNSRCSRAAWVQPGMVVMRVWQHFWSWWGRGNEKKAFLRALYGIGWGRGAVGYSRDGFLEEGTGFNRKQKCSQTTKSWTRWKQSIGRDGFRNAKRMGSERSPVMGKLHTLQKHLQEKDPNEKSLPRVECWATVKILV